MFLQSQPMGRRKVHLLNVKVVNLEILIEWNLWSHFELPFERVEEIERVNFGDCWKRLLPPEWDLLITDWFESIWYADRVEVASLVRNRENGCFGDPKWCLGGGREPIECESFSMSWPLTKEWYLEVWIGKESFLYQRKGKRWQDGIEWKLRPTHLLPTPLFSSQSIPVHLTSDQPRIQSTTRGIRSSGSHVEIARSRPELCEGIVGSSIERSWCRSYRSSCCLLTR